MTARGAVLVIGDDSRSFLSVVRSLGRRGLEVHAAPFDLGAPALASRFVAATHQLPGYNIDPRAWAAAIVDLHRRHRFQLVIPCDDRSILPMARQRADLAGVPLALPNDTALDFFFDKAATRALATKCGVPVAAGRVLTPDDRAATLAGVYGLPAAIKPRRSFNLEQIDTRFSVRIVDTIAKLSAIIDDIEAPGDYLIESFFEGEGVGVSVLADRGRIVQAFAHRRLAESGPTGGSSLRAGEAVDPALLDHVERMAAETALHGVAMFEFRRDKPSGEVVLLEVNARFWGSLPLAIGSGVDFPAMLYDLLVDERAPLPIRYRPGRIARNLGGDYYRTRRELARATPLRRVGIVLGETFSLLFRVVRGQEHHDTFAWDDMRPWRREVDEITLGAAGSVLRRVPGAGLARRVRARRRLARIVRDAGPAGLCAAMICYGNICRSPYAEVRLRQRLAGRGLAGSAVSAGILGREGRRSPADAVDVAAARGVDLTDHRSRAATPALIGGSDIVIAFDNLNIRDLAARGLAKPGATFLLSDLGGGPVEILDPFGLGPAAFSRAYKMIDRAIDRLAEQLG